MRILVIRGKNLASLAGEFTLDFQSEPLASAGLYAITGATGSGKSTLLDALCLALYEQTPRLSGIAGSTAIIDIGSFAVTPGDVRTILRRGCSDGYAEVDFVASNAIRYRSRWAVRRAHGKANGKLQQSEISLTRLSDGQALGDHRKTETLKLIQNLIGLSFEQFTRAVLLAQNDFTAFLKATDDARAELLQNLTGTESYAKISMLAFERMKAEKEKLAALQEKWQSLEPLTPESRAEKTAQLQAQSAQLEVLIQQKLAIEAQLRWYQLGDQLQEEQSNARAILVAALTNKNAAAARASQLELLDKVQSARPLCSELTRLDQAETDAAHANDLAQIALVQAQTALDAYAVKHIAALQQCESAEVAKAQAQPDIDAAKAVDASIATLTPQVAAALHECSSAADQLQLELRQQAGAAARMQSDQAKLAAAQQWLKNNAALRPLAQAWQRWETLFDEAKIILDRCAKATLSVAELDLEVATFNLDFSRASETKTLAEQALQQALAQLTQLDTDCAAFDVEQLVAEKTALELSQTQRQTALGICEKFIHISDLQRQQDRQLQQHDAASSELADVLSANLLQLPLLQCAAQTAQESLQLATLATSKNAESMRAALQPGQHCPVCGALAHPYAEHSPAFQMLKSLQEQLSTKQKALRDLELGIAAAQANRVNAETSITHLRVSLTQLDAERAALNVLWANHAMRQALDAVPELRRVQTLNTQLSAGRIELVRLGALEALYRGTLKRKEAAQAEFNASNTRLTKAKDAFVNLDAARTAANRTLETAQRDLLEFSKQLENKQSQLDGAFAAPNWREQWRQDPSAFVTQRRSEVDAWTEQLENVAALNTNIAQLQITLSVCEKACALAAGQHAIRREKHASLALTLQNYSAHRNALFAGQPIRQVEAMLNSAVLQAKAALTALEDAMKTAQAGRTRMQEVASQTDIRLALERNAANLARLNLDRWLLKFNSENSAAPQNLTLLALNALLNVSPEWRAIERAALQALSNAVQSAQAVLNARSESLSSHHGEQSVFEARDALQPRLAQLQTHLSALSEAISELKVAIKHDADHALAADALQGKIEAQTADAFVWAQLGDLIGSADGKKFRNFAQQLTLDILLSHANAHLQSLTRRYRVQRIENSLGLLVVDQDMGDEVRSVHSLSGGESFLLSLALALGLASLSSHRVQVESLFIDEGFGSLDSESLDIAMDALDNLQSQGRKIGVISHLQELTQRIPVQVHVQRQAGGASKLSFATLG